MRIRTLPELRPLLDILLDSEKERWLNHTLTPEASENKTFNTCVNHIEDYKVGTEGRLVQNFRDQQILWFYELPDSPGSSWYAPSTNESEMSFVCFVTEKGSH